METYHHTVRLRWTARDLGFEKIMLKRKSMTAYLVSNQDSEYYQTDTFIKIIKYATSHPQSCKVKELNGKNILCIEPVNKVSEALKIINEIMNIDNN